MVRLKLLGLTNAIGRHPFEKVTISTTPLPSTLRPWTCTIVFTRSTKWLYLITQSISRKCARIPGPLQWYTCTPSRRVLSSVSLFASLGGIHGFANLSGLNWCLSWANSVSFIYYHYCCNMSCYITLNIIIWFIKYGCIIDKTPPIFMTTDDALRLFCLHGSI